MDLGFFPLLSLSLFFSPSPYAILNDNAAERVERKRREEKKNTDAFPREMYKIDIDGTCKRKISTIHAVFFSFLAGRCNCDDLMHHFDLIRFESN